MQAYRYIVTVKIIATEEIKKYRIKTTLAGVEKWFNKNFKEGEAIIIDVVFDPNQN